MDDIVLGMGSIVSTCKESSSEEVHPTQAVALQAKLRQAALSLHPHLVWSMAHSEAFGEGSRESGPDWYPAGVSPWYQDHGELVVDREPPSSTQNSSDWIGRFNLNKCDLHKSAIRIQKLVRGHQARKELYTRQQSATKIQRAFRSRRGSLAAARSLPVLDGVLDGKAALLTGRALSAHTGNGLSQHTRQWHIQKPGSMDALTESTANYRRAINSVVLPVAYELAEGEQNKESGTWHQQLSLTQEPVHENEEATTKEILPSVDETSDANMNGTFMVETESEEPVVGVQPVFVTYPATPNNPQGGSRQRHVFFPASLISPLVRTGHSPSNPQPRSTHRSGSKRQVTTRKELGAHLPEYANTQDAYAQHTRYLGAHPPDYAYTQGVYTQHNERKELGVDLPDYIHTRFRDVQRSDGRGNMYAPVPHGETIKQRVGVSRGGKMADISPNSGIKSITLQKFDQRWVKPPVEKRGSRQTKGMTAMKFSQERMTEKNNEKSGYESMFSLETFTEDKRLRFITQESEVCAVDKQQVCPVKTVESLLNLLSHGVGKPVVPPPNPYIETKDSQLHITYELIHTVQSVLKRQLSLTLEPKDFADGSIIIKPSDVESLLRAAEFRSDIVHKLKHLTTEIRLDYYQLMDDIERTQFYAAQQMEAGLVNYHPLKLVLISSIIPKAQVLAHAVREGVLVYVYNFADELKDVLGVVKRLLEGVRAGAKAKHVAIVCKGGPGYFYIVKKTPVTPAKLRSSQSLLDFWRGLGGCMSKLIPGQSTLHLMESNMAGNRQGEKLLTDLESVLYAHQVTVTSPLELAPKGREMINLYFEPLKHKLWKTKRYTKLRLY